MSIINISSSSHFGTVTSSNNYVVTDFYATWCGPCKMIAPIFEKLARDETRPGKIVFAKVDVDAQSDVARQYGVSAMPTFLIFKNGAISDTIRGADASSLKAAVLKASNAASKMPGQAGPAFQTKGRVLGSNTNPGPSVGSGPIQQLLSGMMNGRLMSTVSVFIGLYFVSLFSFDWYEAARGSQFNVNNKMK